jgi:tRNA(fMet)-specific endonuclease VapC
MIEISLNHKRGKNKMKYMMDTNICIYIIKKRPENVFRKFHTLKPGDVCISSITLAELQYGIEKSEQKERNKISLAYFLALIDILPFQNHAAICYGKIRAELESAGKITGAYDLMIAAHCISQDLTLITNNTSEFKRVSGLRVENWV